DLAGAVVLAQLAAQVALDSVELVLLGFHIERQGPAGVVLRRHRRQLAAAGGEEGAFDVIVPLDGVEDANGPLGFDEAVAERADRRFIRVEGSPRLAVGGGREFAHRGRSGQWAKSALLFLVPPIARRV